MLHSKHTTTKTTQPTKMVEELGILLSDIKSQQIHWLWHNRIPLGKITIMDGDPGLGKSLITLDLAARITTGRPMPDDTPGVKGSVILVAPEDGAADTIKPRIIAAGGDPSFIRLLTTVSTTNPITGENDLSFFTLSEHLLNFVNLVQDTKPTLVIIDPLMAVLGPNIKASQEQQIRQLFALLAFLAQHTHCAILLVRHLNKDGQNNPLYRGGGSIGIIATVRTGLIVVQHPFDPKKRILAATKNNLSEKASNLTYQVIANEHNRPFIQWLGTNDYSVATLLQPLSTNFSLERQELLKILQATNHPLGPKELAKQTGQDHKSVRQMLRRMLNAGDILSPAYGLYTTHHPSSPEQLLPENTDTTPTTPTTPATLEAPTTPNS